MEVEAGASCYGDAHLAAALLPAASGAPGALD